MSELVNLIDNIETTRFETFGTDDPTAMGQPYWGIDMDSTTDKALRNIVDDIKILTTNTAMMEPAMKDIFDGVLKLQIGTELPAKIISRIYNRVVINKRGWVYEDVKDLNAIIALVVQTVFAAKGNHTKVPKQIISIQ